MERIEETRGRGRWGARKLARLGIASALALGCASAPAFAQWSADATVEDFRWREHTSPIEVRERGPRFGLGLGLAQHRQRGLLLAGRASVRFGAVRYDGALLLDPTRPAEGTTSYFGTTESAELRYRWPDRLDVVAGVDLDLWRRRFSATQREHYRFVSARLGAEHVASDRSPWIAGAGVRVLLDSYEDARFELSGTVAVTLRPGLGSHPFLHVGYRIHPRLALIAGWDGMRIGRSADVTITQPSGVVFQPRSDMDQIELRLVYQGGTSSGD